MSRVDEIGKFADKCTGCVACVDACPVKCVTPIIKTDGFRYVQIDNDCCVGCGKCYSVCPIINDYKHDENQKLYAAYSTIPNGQNNGSSGGIFELIAKHLLDQGYYVCGAAFEGTILKHKIINKTDELKPLLKSKYVQSDTTGVYNKVYDLLKNNEKVLFCGTPCQVSALKNFVPNYLTTNLITADIICHGVPSQKTFDMYISSLEKKHDGRITSFSFRVKDNKYKHAHGYTYSYEKNGEVTTVNGVYTQSSFYNAFKNYLIFRECCYDCRYSTLNRVSDITLADFWGIEKYGFKGNVDKGVSMIITNTIKGQSLFDSINPMMECQEYPIEYGVESNYCLTRSTKKPKCRDKVIKELFENGYEKTAEKYFSSGFIFKLYWLIPPTLRNIIRKLRR